MRQTRLVRKGKADRDQEFVIETARTKLCKTASCKDKLRISSDSFSVTDTKQRTRKAPC